jgi:hypothetical protein
MMKEEKKGIPLIESNPYLRSLTVEQYRYLVEMSAYESSIFEGATGLQRPVLPMKSDSHRSFPASSAPSKKRAKGS